MSMGQALRQAREAKGLRQSDLGRDVYASGKTISAYETGRRRLPREVVPTVAARLDDARFAMEAAEEITAGIAPPVLDGPKVDLHRVTVRDRTIEELHEALDRLAGSRVILLARSPADLDDAGRAEIEACLMEMIEAQTALSNGVAVLAEVYAISPAGLYRRHRQELAAKGYISKERARRRTA